MSKTAKIILISAGALLVGGALFIWYWYSKHTSDVHLKYVPKEAAAVFSIHTRELAAKLDPSQMKSLKPAEQTVNDIPDFIVNLMTDPFGSGIDPVQNIYGFAEKHNQTTATALVVAISDEGDFATLVSKMFPERNAEEADGMKYLDIDDTRALGWNDEVALFVAVNDLDVRAYTEKLLAQQEENSIVTNEEFKTFNAKTFDAGLFTDNKKLSGLNMETSALSLVGMGEGHSEFFVRFEQNEIVTEYVTSAQTGTPMMKKEGIPAAELNLLGIKDPLLFIGLNLDVNALLNVANSDPNMAPNVEGITGALGLTQAEMAELFTGTITATVSDYQDIFKTDPRVKAETEKLIGPITDNDGVSSLFSSMMSIEVPVTSISMGVTDEEKVNLMLKSAGMKEMDGGFWAAPGIELVVYAVVKSKHLVITNDFLTAQAIAMNGTLPGKLPADYASKVSGQPFSFWMDFDKSHMPPLLLAPVHPILGADDLASYVGMSELLSTVKFEVTKESSTFHFVMPSSEENSLVRTIKYLSPQ